ncbi:phosphoglycerate mutase [Oceanithermus profundus DSM 14977]|uniref:Phosphoglycerate mutase n=1 Tax=Oceanithermus profundus (strain DSM 14977 / NBRC 100410 / VKM B-2274 / 506) TaxID=670487 RepID=E4U5S9_OCEP5|nr:histidine phosphatase family protein [Oceanithermus profundus]ADR35693.1 phosphoglycerate mutase [Oceanithermus profundus DSM 14977]
MEVWLVRHGVTAHNQNGIWQGQRDVPLAPEGRAQARRLAERLARLDLTWTTLHASDLSRALETARIVAERLGLGVRPDRRLREVCVGELAGLTRPEVQARFADYVARSQEDPWHTRFPGGETLAELYDRVWAFLNELGDGRHLVVSHGGAIRAAVLGVLEAQSAVPWRIRLENTSITRLHFPEGAAGGGFVHTVGDAAHLEAGWDLDG